jgi:hypothetical protein
MSASTFVFESALADTLKATLETLIDDDTEGLESKAVFTKWMDVRTMNDAYEDDLELGGPGLAMEVQEGGELPNGSITEGVLYRYVSRKFGLKLQITEETIEDTKYPMAIKAAKRLNRALWKTADVDATNRLARAFSTSYPGGDAVPLISASHPLPNGGTFSNLMNPAIAPSVAALIVAKAAILKYPGHDGVTEGYNIAKAVFPTEQFAVWEELTKSKMRPEAGNFAAINVVNSYDLDLVPVKYWTNTTTNWILLTDADDGLNFRWRRRPRARSYVENSQEVMVYSNSARWAHGWSDPRCAFGSNA